MEDNNIANILNGIYQDIMENFDLQRKLERLKVFANDHPFLTMFIIISVFLCSIPVACFLAFAIISIFLTIAGFMFLEGTVLAFATVILGGVLILMGIFSLGFSITVATTCYLLRKGQTAFQKISSQFQQPVTSMTPVQSQTQSPASDVVHERPDTTDQT